MIGDHKSGMPDSCNDEVQNSPEVRAGPESKEEVWRRLKGGVRLKTATIYI